MLKIAERAILILLVLAAVGVITYALVAHPFVSRWGATDEEVSQTLPGDELVSQPEKETGTNRRCDYRGSCRGGLALACAAWGGSRRLLQL